MKITERTEDVFHKNDRCENQKVDNLCHTSVVRLLCYQLGRQRVAVDCGEKDGLSEVANYSR